MTISARTPWFSTPSTLKNSCCRVACTTVVVFYVLVIGAALLL